MSRFLFFTIRNENAFWNSGWGNAAAASLFLLQSIQPLDGVLVSSHLQHVTAEKLRRHCCCLHVNMKNCNLAGFGFFFLSHKPFSNNALPSAVNTKHMKPLSSSWWQGNSLCTVWSSFLTGSSSRLQIYPGSEKKRNKTQSLKSLSRLWLIHICLALFRTNKTLRRSRINTTQGALGVLVLKVHNSQTKANLTDQLCSTKIWFWWNVSAKIVVFGNIWE